MARYTFREVYKKKSLAEKELARVNRLPRYKGTMKKVKGGWAVYSYWQG